MRLSHVVGIAIIAIPFQVLGHTFAPESSAFVSQALADGCVLPAEYHVLDFVGKSNDTKKLTLETFDFGFNDTKTLVATICHFNSTSIVVSPPGYTPRYSCDDTRVQFIYEQDFSKLWLIERLCPENGKPQWETSGSIELPLKCTNNCHCQTNSTDHLVTYTSLNPIREK